MLKNTKVKPGDRVEIIELCNDEPNYPKGSQGTVLYLDDAKQIHVAWDNGGSIALVPQDTFKILGGNKND